MRPRPARNKRVAPEGVGSSFLLQGFGWQFLDGDAAEAHSEVELVREGSIAVNKGFACQMSMVSRARQVRSNDADFRVRID